jgi:hypothetical protein
MDGMSLLTVVVVVISLVVHAAAVGRLKRTDPSLFANMGSPELMHSDYRKSSWMFFDYMIRCHFLRQGDIVLATLGSLWYSAAKRGR